MSQQTNDRIDSLDNIKNFYNFFGGLPDDVLTSEYLPCSEVKESLYAELVTAGIMPLIQYVHKNPGNEDLFAEFMSNNRQMLDIWQDIISDHLSKLNPDDPRVLYRYDIVTIPDTFKVDFRTAAIPTLRGVVLASWTSIRYNDKDQKQLMITPSISLYADQGKAAEADLAIIREALTDDPSLKGDAGAVLVRMVSILNRKRLLS